MAKQVSKPNNHNPDQELSIVRTPDSIKNELIVLHDIYGLSYSQIAEIPDFQPIPRGTLCAIKNGYPIPKKWRRKLYVRITNRPRRIAIHCTDMESATKSIIENIDIENVRDLIDRLNNWLTKEKI